MMTSIVDDDEIEGKHEEKKEEEANGENEEIWRGKEDNGCWTRRECCRCDS